MDSPQGLAPHLDGRNLCIFGLGCMMVAIRESHFIPGLVAAASKAKRSAPTAAKAEGTTQGRRCSRRRLRRLRCIGSSRIAPSCVNGIVTESVSMGVEVNYTMKKYIYYNPISVLRFASVEMGA